MKKKVYASKAKKSAALKRIMTGKSSIKEESERLGVHVTTVNNWMHKNTVKTVVKNTKKKVKKAAKISSIAISKSNTLDTLVYGTPSDKKKLLARLLSNALLND